MKTSTLMRIVTVIFSRGQVAEALCPKSARENELVQE